MSFAALVRRTLGPRNSERIAGALIDAGTALIDVPFTDEAAARIRERVMREIERSEHGAGYRSRHERRRA